MKNYKDYYKIKNNILGYGDCLELIKSIESDSIDLIVTSPPYYSAKPEYSIYENYELYLKFMKDVILECHRVLKKGRFFAINTSPVLVARENRNTESIRLPIPFDLNTIIMSDNKFKFIEDIIWEKPEQTVKGRNRNFLQILKPLTYKCNAVTEYIMIYRKDDDNLIDWHLKNHPNQDLVNDSKINNPEKTNIWKISPISHKIHPAVYPIALPKKLISYYSFVGDTILDPFAGSGTTGFAALQLKRNFVLFEQKKEYFDYIHQNISGYCDFELID
jgi:DNA modification methylase